MMNMTTMMILSLMCFFVAYVLFLTHQLPPRLQVCLGSVDVCDARVHVNTRAADLHPSWLDTESQVRLQQFHTLTVTTHTGLLHNVI